MQVMDDVEDLRPAHVFVLPGGRPVGTTPLRPWHLSQLHMRRRTPGPIRGWRRAGRRRRETGA
ncbi:hypothetical protein A5767_16805 [Rhodococcus sp. 852002-51564_SCH6189132-a]|nr:hypothetical protein A5767_16805 [Rhodococcus sp. 852002-51564_SCH6189132-a]